MNTNSRRLGRVTAVGFLRRRSPGFGGTSKTRRFRTFPPSPREGSTPQLPFPVASAAVSICSDREAAEGGAPSTSTSRPESVPHVEVALVRNRRREDELLAKSGFFGCRRENGPLSPGSGPI